MSDSWLDFWAFLDQLVAKNQLVVDRPRGSSHPRYPELIYPLDYGYLSGTFSGDGAGIDVWVGTGEDRLPGALLLTVDLKKQDAEIKILLGCSPVEERTILEFMNQESMRAVLSRRTPDALFMIGSRQSIRRFTSDPVDLETIQRVLEAAIQAPSAHNRQPWRFAVLTAPEARTRLAGSMGEEFRRDLSAGGLSREEVVAQVERSYRRIVDAPVAILLCLEMTEMDEYPDPARQQAEYLMAVQSVAMAGENLLLAAHAAGLGGVWICAPLFAPGAVRSSLDLPESWQPQGLLLLGHPAKIPEPRPRKPLSEVVRFF